MVRNHSAPRVRMCGTFDRVSTLLTSVGFERCSSLEEIARAPAPHPACGTEANSPCSYGGSTRGSGGFPSITSSMAFSSPNRYSSGPRTTVIRQSWQTPASPSSTIARSSRSTSSPKRSLMQMNASAASTAKAAVMTPSTSWYGFARSSARSLNVPGSPSAALQTT